MRDMCLGLSTLNDNSLRRKVIPCLSGVDPADHDALCKTAERGAKELGEFLGVTCAS